jgi:hypothetical protein
LEIRLLTGDHAGQTVLIPRITICPTDDQSHSNSLAGSFQFVSLLQ